MQWKGKKGILKNIAIKFKLKLDRCSREKKIAYSEKEKTSIIMSVNLKSIANFIFIGEV